MANFEVLVGMEGAAAAAVAKPVGNNLSLNVAAPRALTAPERCLQLAAPKQLKALLPQYAESLRTPITDPSKLLSAPRGRNPDLPGGPIIGVLLPAGFKFNQAVSPGQSSPGAYGALATIPDIRFVRTDLAVIPGFKQVISGSRVVEVIRPVRAQFSIVGPQVENGVLYPGGEWQIRILEYDRKDPFVRFVGDENTLR